MSSRTDFAYAQARLQARHGVRAGEADWRRLASTGNLANFLQAAQHTPLRPWLQGLQTSRSSHAIELQLRGRFRDYVTDVARWMPAPWRPSMQWVRCLPDLPALQYLQRHEQAPSWMHDDPALRELALNGVDKRLEVLRQSDCAGLAAAWRQERWLPEAWLEHWRRLWPSNGHRVEGLAYLAQLLLRYLQQQHTPGGGDDGDARGMLGTGLRYAFRRYSFQPAAAAAHLGLVALDLERLRGELVRRALFDEFTAVQA